MTRTSSSGARACAPIALILLPMILLAGCGGGGGNVGPVPPSAAATSEQGWRFFSQARYDSAVARFDAAIALDSVYADAWNGLGWAQAFRGELVPAASAFTRANADHLANAEAWAGLAAVDREIDPAAGLAACDSALTRSPDFVFSHDPEVNARDLHLLRAQIAIYFDLLLEAQAEADMLSPGNGLDPAVPSSWVVGGVAYDGYYQALAELLMVIEDAVGRDLPTWRPRRR